jgi:hypothetical protein
LTDGIEHIGRAVRQDCGPQARLFQAREDVWDFGKCIERQVKIHQAIAQARLFDGQRLQREVESVPGDLPEIRVPALHGAQPGILQLLVAPERGQFVDAVPEHIAAAPGRSGKIEQRPVGVEDAGLHADERCLFHARYLTYAHLR